MHQKAYKNNILTRQLLLVLATKIQAMDFSKVWKKSRKYHFEKKIIEKQIIECYILTLYLIETPFKNRADPDQAALVRTAWSGSTLFAYGNMIKLILH